MPQFDLYSFATQVFWFMFVFALFYFFVLYWYLVRFSEVLKMRKKLIDLLNQKKKPLDLYIRIISKIFKGK